MGNDPTSCDNTILIAALRDIQDGYSYFKIFTSQKARYKIEQNAYCLLTLKVYYPRDFSMHFSNILNVYSIQSMNQHGVKLFFEGYSTQDA